MEFSGIDDMRRLANRRLPGLFRDYVDGGSFQEATLEANRSAFGRWTITPRCLTDVSQVDIETDCLGERWGAPFMLAPLGFGGMMWPGGESLAASAAARVGVPMGVSTFSIASMEELSRTNDAKLYSQIYVFRDRSLTQDMLARAKACGVRTIILTVDTPITPLRRRDARNGFRRLTRPSPALLASMALHPRWSLGMARGGKPKIGNLEPYHMGATLLEQAGNAAGQIDPTLTWRDLDWLRAEWAGKLVVKGVMESDDARACMSAGADGVVVSNHGGRQMDPAPATLDVLQDIVAAVAGRGDVILDSGVRCGGDVVTALALGATAVAIGRPWAWGLAAGGHAGVMATLGGLAKEIRDVMALAGLTSISALRARGAAILRARTN
ncbi:oxidoreductase [Acetobacter nitrogenifigens DSM 23921 = NBRC 105050]|uniref:Alpha-hydroxy-acid oxidizing enzyme n=1 Tax=Acetobacter nitrogenifigens DSM 23921 = NBRC 105050 TaxID=1120919 RepID=A0A511X7V8_9PROT|nr:alpha-hydroxy acid oxidase [Acetobacter nitrogenifigens]GBQ88992.1 oxidoreductase [Acetobacter nitrogenifigens DSM 23921 = NBRC 105050]GEN59033.1 alpha-hydroxy-acid oxidizing enzyme [Acetobacter nitrogenifigens DSM 23921 = NBRC 105050]